MKPLRDFIIILIASAGTVAFAQSPATGEAGQPLAPGTRTAARAATGKAAKPQSAMPAESPADPPLFLDDKTEKPKPPKFVEPASPRIVPYSPEDVIGVNTHVRFMTVIVLPMGEQIVDTYCGDTDFWKIDAVANLVYIKPTKSWIATNLTLLGKSGTLYTFYLREVDDIPNTKPDLKLTVSFNEPQRAMTAAAGPKFVSKQELDNVVQDYQQQLLDKEASNRQTRQAADNALAKMRLDYPAQLNFDYQIALNTSPFFVTAMYADTKFT